MSFFLRGNSSSRLQRRSYVVDPSKSIRDDYNRQLIDGSRRDFVCDGTDGEYSDNWIATKSLEWVRISQSKYKIQRRICTSNANNIHRNDGQHTYHAPGPDGSFKYRMSVVSDSSNCHRHPSTETVQRLLGEPAAARRPSIAWRSWPSESSVATDRLNKALPWSSRRTRRTRYAGCRTARLGRGDSHLAGRNCEFEF